MACGCCNRKYMPVSNWTKVDYTNEYGGQNCVCRTNCDQSGFDWLAAMQAEAQQKCGNQETCGTTNCCDGRRVYLADVLNLLMTLAYHQTNE